MGTRYSGFRSIAVAIAVSAAVGGCASDKEDNEELGLNHDPTGLEIPVNTGTVIGQDEAGTRLFLGIPYAKAPVGPLRFSAPQPAEPWQQPLEAFEFGPSCPQASGSLSASNGQDEDCLSLNVFAPSTTSESRRPVMVWIHGGAFTAGGSSQYREATTLSAAGDVIVVTLNYRLGALGFLAATQLSDGEVPAGNYGLRDQQMALRWVHDNIANFDGDPNNVTVFGESAGSVSVCYQMFAEGSEDLGQRFILESGTCLAGGISGRDRDSAGALGAELVDELCEAGSDPVACLRDLPVDALLEWRADQGLFGAGWGPHVDGPGGLLPKPTNQLLEDGAFNPGEIIAGSNYNEWALFSLLGGGGVKTIEAFNTAIDGRFPAIAEQVKALYAPATDADAAGAFDDAMTDASFLCPTRALARAFAAKDSKVYLYSFGVAPGYHALELDYVFGRESLAMQLGSTKIPALGDSIQSYWTRFAATGDPNSDGEVSWPAYTTAADTHLNLAKTVDTGSALREPYCDFWASLNGN